MSVSKQPRVLLPAKRRDWSRRGGIAVFGVLAGAVPLAKAQQAQQLVSDQTQQTQQATYPAQQTQQTQQTQQATYPAQQTQSTQKTTYQQEMAELFQRSLPPQPQAHQTPPVATPEDAQSCSPEWRLPGEAPVQAGDYNAVAMPEVCLGSSATNNVFIIGDWGGIDYHGKLPPIPADKRSKAFPGFHRRFVWGVDDRAQLLVAEQMRIRAASYPPDLILNVGDNFYWGGVEGKCGEAPTKDFATGQWKRIFENVYWGPGIDGKPWFGVLGNHDYGGYQFQSAWENAIGYTWGQHEHATGRWRTPAQYYMQKVNYDGFSVDYYFIDSNVMEAWAPDMAPAHNLCGLEHNGQDATCGAGGPHDIYTCSNYFHSMWEQQMVWLESMMGKSTSDWQIVITHFPPKWGSSEWQCLGDRYGTDLIITGHTHYQGVYGPEDTKWLTGGTSVVVSGGGGGITCEGFPHVDGNDDEYGFMHMTLSANNMKIEAISHSGVLRKTINMHPRQPNPSHGQCFHFNVAAGFSPLQGGVGRGCRGTSAEDDAADNYMLEADVPTIQSCMRKCVFTSQCYGIEYGNQVCQLWVRPIKATVALPGFECLLRTSGALPSNEAEPPAAQETAEMQQLSQNFGPNFECRDSSGTRNAGDFVAGRAETVEICEKQCAVMGSQCMGIEFGPGTVCNLWVVPVESSSARSGVTCVPSTTNAAPGASISEVGGLLHV